MRKPFQGVQNIIRFNWHFYLIASLVFSILITICFFTGGNFRLIVIFILVGSVLSVLISLLVSWYVYDLSGLYELNWINPGKASGIFVNIHAGFDETSQIIAEKFRPEKLIVLDFYDPEKHTEVSIRRARIAYPVQAGTRQIQTDLLPFENNSVDRIFLIFAAHEIRNEKEREVFFTELHRVLKNDGDVIVTEHLRDIWNFFAYTVGFFHFYPKHAWIKLFAVTRLKIESEIRVNRLVTCFTLKKNGIAN